MITNESANQKVKEKKEEEKKNQQMLGICGGFSSKMAQKYSSKMKQAYPKVI